MVLVALVWPVVALAQGPDFERVNELLRTTNFMDGLPRGWKSKDNTGKHDPDRSQAFWECRPGKRCYVVTGPGGTEYSVGLLDHVEAGPPDPDCVDLDQAQINYLYGPEPPDTLDENGLYREPEPTTGEILSGMGLSWCHDFGHDRYVPVHISYPAEVLLFFDITDPDGRADDLWTLAELVENKLDGIASGSAPGAAGWTLVPPWVPIGAGLLGAGGALWFLLHSGLLGPLSAGGAVQPQPGLQPRPQPMPMPQPRPQPQPEQLRAQQQERVKKVLDKLDDQANQCLASAQPIRAGLEARMEAMQDRLTTIQSQRSDAIAQRDARERDLERRRAERQAQMAAKEAALGEARQAFRTAFSDLESRYPTNELNILKEKLWGFDPEDSQMRVALMKQAQASVEGNLDFHDTMLSLLVQGKTGATGEVRQAGIEHHRKRVEELRSVVLDVPGVWDMLVDEGPRRQQKILKKYDPVISNLDQRIQGLERPIRIADNTIGRLKVAERNADARLADLKTVYEDVGWLDERKAEYDQARQGLQQFVQQANPLDPSYHTTLEDLRRQASSAANRVCQASSYMINELDNNPGYLDAEPYPGYLGDVDDLRQARDNYHRRQSDLESYLRHHGPGEETYDPATERKMRALVDGAKDVVDLAEDRIRDQGGRVPLDEGPGAQSDPYGGLDMNQFLKDQERKYQQIYAERDQQFKLKKRAINILNEHPELEPLRDRLFREDGPVDEELYEKIKRYNKNQNQMPDYSEWEYGWSGFFYDASTGMLKDFVKGPQETWKKPIVAFSRMTLGIITGGYSEMVLAPAGELWNMKEYVDKVDDPTAWGAFTGAVKNLAIGELVGFFLGGGKIEIGADYRYLVGSKTQGAFASFLKGFVKKGRQGSQKAFWDGVHDIIYGADRQLAKLDTLFQNYNPGDKTWRDAAGDFLTPLISNELADTKRLNPFGLPPPK